MPELPEDMRDHDPDLQDAPAEPDDDGSGPAEAAQRAADWASSDSPIPAQVPAEDSGEDDDVAADSAADAEADEDTTPPAPRSTPLEPISGWMLRVALSLIVVLLVTTGTLVFFLLSLQKAPRTVAERDLSVAESAVREQPGDTASWTKLVYAYAQLKRVDEALAAADKGRRLTKADALLLAKADVLRSAGRFKEAVGVYDRAGTAIEEAQAETIAARKKTGIFIPLKDVTMVRVYYGRAISLHALGKVKPAITDLERAVALAPEQAYLFVTLGDYYAEIGGAAKAEAAYRNALRYVPDYAEALAGLKRLNGGK